MCVCRSILRTDRATVGPHSPRRRLRLRASAPACGSRLTGLGRRRHVEDRAARLAGAQLRAAVELLDDRLELLAQIDQGELGVVDDGPAALAVPAQVVVGARRPL